MQAESSTPTTTAAPPAPSKPARHIPKPVRILAIAALVSGIGVGVYELFFKPSEANGLFLSGRIESYETDIAPKIGGRIDEVAVHEGDLVKPGELLVRIDDADLQAQLRGAIANVQAAQQKLQKARQQIPVLQAQLEQATLTVQQVTENSQGRVTQAENDVSSMQAQLAEAQANLRLAQTQQRRYQELYQSGAVSADQRDQYNAQAETAQAKVNSLQNQLQAARGSLTQARSSLQNTPIQSAVASQLRAQIAQAHTDVDVAQQDLEDAKAKQSEIEANLDYLVIHSPMSGSVITRSVEPGEVVSAGAPLLTLINLDRLYLRGFIPEGEIGKVKLGQPGLVYLDSFPDQPFEATVTRIDPKASFTPENTYFKEDRVTQAFGVELTLKDPQGLVKPGMPADGRILIDQENSDQENSSDPSGTQPSPDQQSSISLLGLPIALHLPHSLHF